MIELLSPAKNIEVAKSAILSGADAVYIGAQSFSARSAAGNSVEDIKALCEFAHIFNAKVYVAINTILNDEELAQARDLIWKLYESKVDAVIIQDMGLLECDLPPIALHASTQCHIDSLDKAKFFDSLGFQRIVVARELGLEKIAEIVKNVKCEIECFVHGALCVGYSGQCYLSHAIGSRSGNRGVCAQPCRMPYTIFDAQEKVFSAEAHYLSLKDMNRSVSLEDLIKAGVTSFKIEGRLKEESYVKNVTSFYSEKLNELVKFLNQKRQSFGKVDLPFIPNLEKSFNRRFTEYHLHKLDRNCESFSSPKSRGEYLGEAKFVRGKSFDVRHLKKNVDNGDGLFVENPDGEVFGLRIQKVENNMAYCGQEGGRLMSYAKIWRNSCIADDKDFAKTPIRKLPVHLKVEVIEKEFKLSIKGKNILEASASLSFEEYANKFDMAKARLSDSLSKSADSYFEVKSVDFDCDKLPHISFAQINEIRRNLFENYQKVLSQFNAPKDTVRVESDELHIPKLLGDYCLNILNKKAEIFYQKRKIKVFEYALEYGTKIENKILMRTKHCILREMNLCKKQNKFPAQFSEPLFLENENVCLEIDFDCNNCEMNLALPQKGK